MLEQLKDMRQQVLPVFPDGALVSIKCELEYGDLSPSQGFGERYSCYLVVWFDDRCFCRSYQPATLIQVAEALVQEVAEMREFKAFQSRRKAEADAALLQRN